jgi:hypothetical protein
MVHESEEPWAPQAEEEFEKWVIGGWVLCNPGCSPRVLMEMAVRKDIRRSRGMHFPSPNQSVRDPGPGGKPDLIY